MVWSLRIFAFSFLPSTVISRLLGSNRIVFVIAIMECKEPAIAAPLYD